MRADLIVRRAAPADYPAFSRLFPELGVDDPVPGPEVWASVFVPSTWIAARGDEVLGFCYFQEYEDTGYVRNVVVAPSARKLGVGRVLMSATAAELRAKGKRTWRLNVKPDNQAALVLYARMGMQPQYAAQALRLPWTASPLIPSGNAVVRELAGDRDGELEELFGLERGQLAFARGLGRMLLEAVSITGERSIGLAVFDPKYPGAFPFRVKDLAAVAPLLAAMRPHVEQPYVNLVAEDDERLASLLMSAGASIRFEVLHLQGVLDPLPRQGPRITLRRLRVADLEPFQAYRGDPAVGRFQGWSPMTTSEAVAFLSEMSTAAFGQDGAWFQLGIAERSTDRLIGDLGVCLRSAEDRHAEIGFTLAAEFQGKGLAAEAVREALALLFEETDIARVIAITDARNQASIRLLQRVGMTRNETVSAVFRGEPCEEHVFVLSRVTHCSARSTFSGRGPSARLHLVE